MNKFMSVAIEEAHNGVIENHGGPFGAVIVKGSKIIASGHNEVLKTNDPTAHAEIVAIRQASKLLGRFDLSDCEIYSSCEPCPMCFAAIHWAKIKKLFYGCTQKDAAEIGFDDEFIYNVIKGKSVPEKVKVEMINRTECLEVFKIWENKTDRKQY